MSGDVGIEVYESEFTPEDLDSPLPPAPGDIDFDDLAGLGIEVAPPRPTHPWDALESLGVPRDGHGRPQILPDPAWRLPEAGWPDGRRVRGQMADGRRPFTRVSTACQWNDVAHGLAVWKLRCTLLALARRPDLQALLCGLTYADGPAIDAVTDELLTRGADDGTDAEGEMRAATMGTAWHQLSVPGAPDIHPIYGPSLAGYAIARDAFYAALERAGLELLDHELFGVDYSRDLGGRVDHLVRVVRYHRDIGLDVGTVTVLDKKTGKEQWITHTTQVAMYNRLRPHDWRTGATGPSWHPDLDVDHAFIASASLKTGLARIFRVNTPTYLVDSAMGRYRNSLAAHVKSLVGKAV